MDAEPPEFLKKLGEDPLSSWWPWVIALIVGIVTCIKYFSHKSAKFHTCFDLITLMVIERTWGEPSVQAERALKTSGWLSREQTVELVLRRPKNWQKEVCTRAAF
jgi:hypothetical protein